MNACVQSTRVCSLSTQEVVATDFVMFALPTVLPRDILQSPVEVLEVDVLWPIVHDGLGGAEIRIGETKARATGKAVGLLILVPIWPAWMYHALDSKILGVG